MKDMIEIQPGLFLSEADGLPWSNRRGTLRPLIAEADGYLKVHCIETQKTISFHILVWKFYKGEIPEGMEIDHIDGDITNNRIQNLQAVSHKQNCQKSVCKKKKNMNRLPGAYRTVAGYTWFSSLKVDGKTLYLGAFESEKEASEAYLRAKERVHGKKSTKVIRKEYDI